MTDKATHDHNRGVDASATLTQKQLLRKTIAVSMFKRLHPKWDWEWSFSEYEKMWPGQSMRAANSAVGECVALADIAMNLCNANEH